MRNLFPVIPEQAGISDGSCRKFVSSPPETPAFGGVTVFA
jgi:hypothetical protein